MRNKIVLWGAGNNLHMVIDEIEKSNNDIVGIVDSNSNIQGMKIYNDITISSPNYIMKTDYDYIIITIEDYHKVLKQCDSMGIDPCKIVPYWKRTDELFVARAGTVKRLTKENKLLKNRLDSMPYELGIKSIPQIASGKELLKQVMEYRASFSRFGDGEFEIIRGNDRPWFQKCDDKLRERLIEVLKSENDKIFIAIAQNFILDEYKDECADAIREYMYGDTRKEILEMLEIGRLYYDTYVTRPYIIYKNRQNADEIFSLFQNILNGRSIIIVEGEYSRIGVRNDLLKGAASIRRILCPHKNAWNVYDDIKACVLSAVNSTEDMVLVSLGPTATVLSYDLAKDGIQTLDIGQIDNEYEWWKRGAKERVAIPGKLVSECMRSEDYIEFEDDTYNAQIIMRVNGV